MASSFRGWGSSWAQTWERVSNPNAMYGSVTIRFTATAVPDQPLGFISGSASFSISATGSLSAVGQQPSQSGGTVRRGTAWLKSPKRAHTHHLPNYNLTRLHQDDQVVTELLIGLVTQGFFDGNR